MATSAVRFQLNQYSSIEYAQYVEFGYQSRNVDPDTMDVIDVEFEVVDNAPQQVPQIPASIRCDAEERLLEGKGGPY